MKKKIPKAAALKYDQGQAPIVISKGEGLIAKKIMEIAEENNIYIHSDPDLVEILSNIDIGSEIPEDIYKTVAQILLFVYELNGDKI